MADLQANLLGSGSRAGLIRRNAVGGACLSKTRICESSPQSAALAVTAQSHYSRRIDAV